MKLVQTAERISHIEESDNVIFQRSLFAYQQAAKLIGGTTLEIGTGMGYGLETIAPVLDKYIAVDKYASPAIEAFMQQVDFEFHQATVPPLSVVESNSVDHVISFQVIEHIKDDKLFVEEIHRVLKPGGTAIITTPNINMSLTRNPWHIREYKVEELKILFQKYFSDVQVKGVYGNEKVMAYYEENKKSVQKYKKLDILNLEYNLPRWMLQIPYDLLNRMNRKKLLEEGNDNIRDISTADYLINEADAHCFDLFAIAKK